MTNPLPDAACNMPIFASKTERDIWGRLTYVSEAKSRNQFMLEILLEGLRARGLSDWATKIEVARAEYKALTITVAKSAMTVALIGWVIVGPLIGVEMRRAKTSVRVRRNETTEAA